MSTVLDIIDGIKHRLPDRTNLYPSLNRAVRLVSKRLFYHKSTLIQGALSETITAGSSSVALPSDFWGLLGWPYLNGEVQRLYPVPDMETKLTYTSTGTPIYYEIKGQTMYFYPGSTAAATLNGDYWQRETKLTKPTDTMPWNELFDDAISEALLQVYTTGQTAGNEITIMGALINKAVDEIVPYMDRATPQRVDDTAGLDYLAEGDW
jgi:hypothetical protein